MEKENEYRLNESSIKRCAEVFNSYAERFKLPKNFLEFKTDFEKLYGSILSNGHYSSWEVQILFKTYLIDYIPVNKEQAERNTLEIEKAAGIANSLVNKMEAIGVAKEDIQKMDKVVSKAEEDILKAKKLHAQGMSYVKISKELGVSDKTAKKYVES